MVLLIIIYSVNCSNIFLILIKPELFSTRCRIPNLGTFSRTRKHSIAYYILLGFSIQFQFSLQVLYRTFAFKIYPMESRTPSESKTILTDLVLPSETNPLNNLFGGELLARMDRAASIAARRHSRRIVVTASVNHVAFNKMIPLGSVAVSYTHLTLPTKA